MGRTPGALGRKTKLSSPKVSTPVKKKKAVGSPLVKPMRAAVPMKGRPMKVATDEKVAMKGRPAKGEKAAADKKATEETKGEKLNVGRFYAIAQCSLRCEARELMGKDFELRDPQAEKLWPEFERMAKRNLGSNEKWVPFHTVLGVHERFLVEEVHHGKISWWTDYMKFVAMFIFRSHCKRELFQEVQMPYLAKKSFWTNPCAAFKQDSPMEKDIMTYRKRGNPLQTSCFLIIPERILKDDDENLIRNLMLRTQRLIKLADVLWGVVNDKKTTGQQKFDSIKENILAVNGLGDTWVKMLMVVIDIAKPNLRLLQDRCEVGIGASDPLRKILEDEGLLQPKVKREVERRENALSAEEYGVVPSLKQGIMAVKKKGNQLIQVTKGMAGSIDRAFAIAEELAKLANKDKSMANQDKLMVKRQALFDNKSFKFKKLGLDEKAAELIARDADKAPRIPDEMTPSEALNKLRERINKSTLPSADAFWKLIAQVEGHARKHFAKLPLVVEQMKTSRGALSAVTLQVQLCEVRQFDNFVAARGVKRGASELDG